MHLNSFAVVHLAHNTWVRCVVQHALRQHQIGAHLKPPVGDLRVAGRLVRDRDSHVQRLHGHAADAHWFGADHQTAV